jgi:hypothetical protein
MLSCNGLSHAALVDADRQDDCHRLERERRQRSTQGAPGRRSSARRPGSVAEAAYRVELFATFLQRLDGV